MDRKKRIHTLQDKITGQGLCGALLFYSRDIFYYTGTAQPSYLVVLPDDFLLFVRSGFDLYLTRQIWRMRLSPISSCSLISTFH
jgi:hypothetical protein